MHTKWNLTFKKLRDFKWYLVESDPPHLEFIIFSSLNINGQCVQSA